MACQVCEESNIKDVSLYNHQPTKISLCVKHANELFLMGERRFINKYDMLAGEYRPLLKRPETFKPGMAGNN